MNNISVSNFRVLLLGVVGDSFFEDIGLLLIFKLEILIFG